MKKAIFLDRDGTLNIYKGFLRNINDLELCDGAAEAVKTMLCLTISETELCSR